MIDDDDAPQGVVLGRREAVRLLGLFGVGLLTSCAPWEARGAQSSGACIALPEQTAGPMFAPNAPQRSDIRAGRPGAPLQLTLNVLRLKNGGCTPLPGAHVDLWQCDASGVYSDNTFLRGYQLTDAAGTTEFTTIYPGWYPGRAVHVHFKIRSGNSQFASQLYFDDTLTDRVHARAPYANRTGRRVRNANDGIFSEGGEQLLLALAENRGAFTSTFNIVLRLG